MLRENVRKIVDMSLVFHKVSQYGVGLSVGFDFKHPTLVHFRTMSCFAFKFNENC